MKRKTNHKSPGQSNKRYIHGEYLGIASIIIVVGVLAAFAIFHRSLAASSNSSIPNAITFFDNFDNEKLTGWDSFEEGRSSIGGVKAQWVVDSETKEVVENSGFFSSNRTTPARAGTILTNGNTGWQDYEYSVKVRSSDDDGIGVVFRSVNSNNYYRFSMNAEDNKRQLVKKVNGTYTLLVQNNQGYTPNQDYVVKVQVVGRNIKVYVDNQLQFNINDSSHPAGRIGLYSWGNQSSFFDDVDVKAKVSSFTIAVLPDTQYYSQRFDDPYVTNNTYPGDIYTMQTEWIAKNRAQQKIAFVLHEGDLVNMKNQDYQWQNASNSMSYLDGKVSQAVTPGNHDVIDYDYAPPYNISTLPVEAENSPFNYYFPESRYSSDQSFGDTRVPGKIDESYYTFSAGGVDYLVISLGFGPSDDALTWANTIASENPDKKVIVLTHSYLTINDTLHDKNQAVNDPAHEAFPREGNDGKEIWEKFVKRHANIQYVLSGHLGGKEKQGRLVSEGDNGNKVYQMLANYQGLGWGGRGWLRLIKVYPSENRVEVKTYSPYLNQYLTDTQSQFEFNNVDM